VNDPNGNKKQDEIPLLGAGAARVLINSFVYYGGGSSPLLNSTEGQLWTPVITDEYREALIYLRKLVEEGLYSPTSFTLDSTQFNAIMNIEDSGEDPYVGTYCAHPTTTFDDTSGRRLDFTAIYPISGPNGVSYAICSPNAQDYYTSITKYCENPEVAVRLLDSFCEREFMLTSRWGVKDRDWIDLGEDNTGYEGCRYGSLGYETEFIYVRNPYGSSNNIIWKWDRLTSLPPALMGAQAIITEENKNVVLADGTKVELTPTTEYSIRSANIVGQKSKDIPDEIVGKIVYNAKEDLEISDIRTSLQTYIDESRTRFILGEMSIENEWESYIKTLEDIGLDRYLEVSQIAYTRTVEATGGTAGGAGIR
jgi:putative aldouronate transport system substrate-binding protein